MSVRGIVVHKDDLSGFDFTHTTALGRLATELILIAKQSLGSHFSEIKNPVNLWIRLAHGLLHKFNSRLRTQACITPHCPVALSRTDSVRAD